MPRNFRAAGHLPNVRGDDGADPGELPRQRRGTTPQMHGRYPDYDCLDQADHWDELTRSVVLARIEAVPALRFFDAGQAAALEAFCDTLLAQDGEPRVPVLAFIDDKLTQGRLDGYRYAGMPDDRETWLLVAEGLDTSARSRGASAFAAAPSDCRRAIMDDFALGELSGGPWERLDVKRAWSVVTRSVLAAFYAHPWAWNEIGFGGPAYPRGYASLGIGIGEPWETEEAAATDPGAHAEHQGR